MKEENVIYTYITNESGQKIRVFATQGDYYEGFMTVKEANQQWHEKIQKFPTKNSAIIWWLRSLTHITKPQYPYVNIDINSKEPIVIGRINETSNSIIAIHRLSFDWNSQDNIPDEKTMTEEEERKEYMEILQTQRQLEEAVRRILGEDKEP